MTEPKCFDTSTPESLVQSLRISELKVRKYFSISVVLLTLNENLTYVFNTGIEKGARFERLKNKFIIKSFKPIISLWISLLTRGLKERSQRSAERW